MPATPPLAWLRAFEAAARLRSFKDAAAELNVSPSTISHQVRDLEGALGAPLFSRQGNKLTLTEEGTAILEPLSQGFELIRRAVSHRRTSDHFRIGAFPFLGSEVLLPAVPELKEHIGLSQVAIQTSTDLSRLVHPEYPLRLDAVIRYGPPPDENAVAFPGFLSMPLFPIQLMPIVGGRIKSDLSIDEMLELPQIRLIGPFDAWQSWSELFDVNLGKRDYVLETDNYHAAVLAVERGDGCCMGVFPFLSQWRRAGRIQALEHLSCEIPEHAYLVFAHHNQDYELVGQFAAWLKNLLK